MCRPFNELFLKKLPYHVLLTKRNKGKKRTGAGIKRVQYRKAGERHPKGTPESRLNERVSHTAAGVRWIADLSSLHRLTFPDQG